MAFSRSLSQRRRTQLDRARLIEELREERHLCSYRRTPSPKLRSNGILVRRFSGEPKFISNTAG